MTGTDPQRDAVYAAEQAALAELGPDLRRWRDVLAYVESVVMHPAWTDAASSPPIDVEVQRRSRSARYAAADATSATIWIPEGRWNAMTVLHELAHLAAPDAEAHGPRFCGAELWLVRWRAGFEAYGALRGEFDRRGVSYCGPWEPIDSMS